MRYLLFFLLFMTTTLLADEDVVNVYIWSNEVPKKVIQQFEAQTGIRVNLSTYDSNETLYTKLKATSNPGYDVIEPSSYYVDRMRHEEMLQPLDKNQLPNYHNLDPLFLHTAYDPTSEYSLPYLWGVSGIFVNKHFIDSTHVQHWSDLWQSRYRNQLLILDDSRDIFSMALLTLGYSANDENPAHIRAAYLRLKSLLSNIKLFNSDAVIPIVIDEDATIGMIWNGDALRAQQENPNVQFIYPAEGFVIWVDAFAIPKTAPHLNNAYKFLNFILRADIAEQGTRLEGYAIANAAGRALLPPKLRNNPTIYPPLDILKQGQFQTDVGDNALRLYETYWELLKIGG